MCEGGWGEVGDGFQQISSLGLQLVQATQWEKSLGWDPRLPQAFSLLRSLAVEDPVLEAGVAMFLRSETLKMTCSDFSATFLQSLDKVS